MRRYGLIGYPITHSFSPGYFSQKFVSEGIQDARYDLYPLELIEEFSKLDGLEGVNVTIPYKEQVIPYLTRLSPEAEAIGAVNTIRFLMNGDIEGHNTDVYGFEESLDKLTKGFRPRTALVLGTGGAGSLRTCDPPTLAAP